MASAFTKQETVFFDELLQGFDDQLTFGRNVSVFNADPVVLERSQGQAIWRPMPYISTSVNGAAGVDISASFSDVTQTSVPIALGYDKAVPWVMTTNDLLDPQQRERKMMSARQKLASDINVAIANVACLQGSIVVKRTSAAAGYDDVAQADSAFLEQGVVGMSDRRVMFLQTRDYNSMANTLAKPQTSANPKVNSAYENSRVGMVAGFDTFKTEYTYRLGAKAASSVTINGNQYYVPAATSTASTGETSNVDNRYMNLAITVGSGTVAVGDCFTIQNVNAVNHITKGDTGQSKTFRITAIISGAGGTGTVQITPPIISGTGGSQAELEYKNVTTQAAGGANVTFLNTVAGSVAPFWRDDAIELLPGRNGFDPDMAAAGAQWLTATTELGVQLVMYKFFDINSKKFKYRMDTRFGVGPLNTEAMGVILFNQT